MATLNWSTASTAWVTQLCQLDPDAWHRFMQTRRPGIIIIARCTGVSPADADAVANDVEFTLFERMKDGKFALDHDGSFNGLLYTMARNKALDFLRRTGREPQRLPEDCDEATDVRRQWDSQDEQRWRLLQEWVQKMEAEGGGRDLEIWKATALEARPSHEVARDHDITTEEVFRAKYRINERLRALAARLLASDEDPR
jgi:RNA polymerase sigma factor (sigma-70 family)